jgi:predicted RND superfamily exporter protein
VLGGILVLSALSALGLTRLRVQDGWVNNFAATSPFRQATARVNEKLFGTHLLQVHLKAEGPAGSADRLLDPAVLAATGTFEELLRDQAGVGGVLGYVSHLTAMAHFWDLVPPGAGLPPDAEMARRVLIRYELGRGVTRRRELLDDAGCRTVCTLFLKDANYEHTAQLMAAIRAHSAQALTPLGLRVDFCGDVAVSQAMIPAVVESQIFSLGIDLVLILTVLIFFYRSVTWAVLAILPTAITVLWVFGLMGWLGIPLGVATSMFCVILLGVGVDYAIYYLEGVRLARASHHPEPWRQALTQVGPAILANVAALSLGFGVLLLSVVPTSSLLGLILTLGMLISCLITLLGLGALFSSSISRGIFR